jgi:hypothetical protein
MDAAEVRADELEREDAPILEEIESYGLAALQADVAVPSSNELESDTFWNTY